MSCRRPDRNLAVICALLVVACGESREASTAPGAGFDVSAVGSCDFRLIKSLANTEFAPKQQNVVQNQIKQMQTASGRGQLAQVTSLGFDVMDQISVGLKNSTITGSPGTGSDLTNALIRCMQVTPSEPLANLDFTLALSSGGAYEVRGLGGSKTELPVYARNGGYSALQGPPVFNATNQPQGSNFFTWLGGRALVYGWPRVEDEFRTEIPVGEAYNWFVIRSGTGAGPLSAPGIVAVCAGSPGSAVRVQHASSLTFYANPFQTVAGWTGAAECPSTLAASTSGPVGFLRHALAEGFRAISPSPAYAALVGRVGGSGGTAGSFSPFGGVTLTAIDFEGGQGGFATSPSTGLTGVLSPQPTFLVQTKNGTPIPGVTIKINLTNNSGSFSVCLNANKVPLTLPLTLTTDENGRAGFTDLAVDKPGGYTMTATTHFDGYPETVATAPRFNLSQGSTYSCNGR
jgi:hypothetical protein